MSDLFGRIDQVFNGGLSADSLFMTFPNVPGSGLGLLIQNIQLAYSQQIRRIHELGPGLINNAQGVPGQAGACDGPVAGRPANCNLRAQPTYYITSIPEGQFSLGRIFGPNLLGSAFFKRYGNPCSTGNNVSLSGIAGCNGVTSSPRQHWDISGFLLGNYAMSATAREMVIEEQLSGMFVGLNLNATAQDGTPLPEGGGGQSVLGTGGNPGGGGSGGGTVTLSGGSGGGTAIATIDYTDAPGGDGGSFAATGFRVADQPMTIYGSYTVDTSGEFIVFTFTFNDDIATVTATFTSPVGGTYILEGVGWGNFTATTAPTSGVISIIDFTPGLPAG